MKISDALAPYDFELPEDRIALRPAEPRDAARLLVIHANGRLVDSTISELPRYLQLGDRMVFNDTRVLPAALKGVRPARDDLGRDVKLDVNLIRAHNESDWWALCRPGRRLKVGDEIVFSSDLTARVFEKSDAGDVRLSYNRSGEELIRAIEALGRMPLPPYIARRRAADQQDNLSYQTMFAAGDAKSVAAPTAGLHFTDSLLSRIDQAGVTREFVRLHVGQGTFASLTDRQIESRRLHQEWRSVVSETANRINNAKAQKNRIIAVGTTSMRTLESCTDLDRKVRALSGPTDLFLRPGDRFRVVDAMITNFHLPRSSLFMLVCAFMGTDVMQRAYLHAIKNNYRFYSYGDACLLLPEKPQQISGEDRVRS